MEEGFLDRRGHVFIRKCAAQRNYAGAPGGSHLRNTWQTCNMLGVVPMFPRTPGLSGGRSHFSGFQVKELALKTDLMFVSVSSAD